MNLQMLAIFLLATFCAGGVAWVVVYPYLSGEKEAERRMSSIAKSSVPTSKGHLSGIEIAPRAGRNQPQGPRGAGQEVEVAAAVDPSRPIRTVMDEAAIRHHQRFARRHRVRGCRTSSTSA